MGYKVTYYEVFETSPKDLMAKMPLISIIRYIMYYSYIIFIFFTNIRMIRNVFKKNIEISGRALNDLMEEPILKKEIPYKSEITFYNRGKSKKLVKEKLLFLFPDFFKDFNIKSNFTIRKRIEYFNGKGKNEVFISLIKLKIVNKIKKIVKCPYENIKE